MCVVQKVLAIQSSSQMSGNLFVASVCSGDDRRNVVTFPGIPVDELTATLKASFSLDKEIIGLRDPEQNIFFPISLLSRAPAYFSRSALSERLPFPKN